MLSPWLPLWLLALGIGLLTLPIPSFYVGTSAGLSPCSSPMSCKRVYTLGQGHSPWLTELWDWTMPGFEPHRQAISRLAYGSP